jgi:hypothetical protein
MNITIFGKAAAPFLYLSSSYSQIYVSLSLSQYFSPTKMTRFAHAAMDASLFTTLSVGCMEQRMTDYLIAR